MVIEMGRGIVPEPPAGWTSVLAGVGRALIRPSTYIGYAREAMAALTDVAVYPMGLMAEPQGPSGPAQASAPPVILVHGFGHNRSAWLYLARHLRQSGISTVETFDYNPLADDVPTLGAALRHRVDALRRRTGADRVDLIGHSMGGIVCRWMIQECGGWDLVRTCVTVSSPHQGTRWAAFGPGRVAHQLRPQSPVIQRLARTLRPSGVRWISYYSNIDALVMPATSARLDADGVRVENILMKDLGHLGILLSGRLAADIVGRLRHPAAGSRPAA